MRVGGKDAARRPWCRPADCPTGKRWYGSAQLARNAAWLLGLIHRSDQGAYRCPHCDAWHLTKDDAGERPRVVPRDGNA